MASPISGIEELFLRIFKSALLVVMGLALIAFVFLLGFSAYQYLQVPEEPTPVQNAPNREPSLSDFKNGLMEQEKQRKEAETKKSMPAERLAAQPSTLKFNEEALTLYRCSVDFAKAVGAFVEETDNQVIAENLEDLRSRIEIVANGSGRGNQWVGSAVKFTCKILADPLIVSMKKEGKIGTVLLPALNFHLRTWDRIQAEKIEFEQMEEKRVASERHAEDIRVGSAKASALVLATAAAAAFLLFMLLTIYLLGARIESNLRNINESIRANIPRQAD